MHALVVYESLWGDTAEVARAIAEGLGAGARALSTAEANPDLVAAAGLIVAGAPVHMGGLPKESSRAIAAKRKMPPDLSQPPMRDWLATLPRCENGPAAAFDTRMAKGFGGSAAPKIAVELEKHGRHMLAEPQGFLVASQVGPLEDGELDRARAWGAELARLIG